MDHVIHTIKNNNIAELTSKSFKINDAQDFLDLIANIKSKSFIINKESINKLFFDLKTGIAGEILQKCSNYNIRLAIVGDFLQVQSKSLNDFIYECNKNKQILFVNSIQEALDIFTN